MDTLKNGKKKQVEIGFMVNGLIPKVVVSVTAIVFICVGISVPTSFATAVPVTTNETQQMVPVVTLEQANAKASVPDPAPVPSGSVVQNTNPLSAPTPVQVQTTPPLVKGLIGSSPNGQYKVYYNPITASARYFIVKDKDGNELWRFDAQGGPYNSIVSYNITNEGVYVLRYETGGLKIKFADFEKKQLSTVTLPPSMPLTSVDSIKFVKGTNRVHIGTQLVDLKMKLEVRGTSPDGQYQVFYNPMTASARYFVVTDKNYNELWRFDAQGGPYNSIVRYNITNEGVYVLRYEPGGLKIKFADFAKKQFSDVTLPASFPLTSAASVKFVKGTNQVYVGTTLVDLKMKLEVRGTSPDGQYQVFYDPMTASARYFVVTDKNYNELWRFDAQGGPYNSIVSYQITNKGVYILRSENGLLKMKFADFATKKLLNVPLLTNMPLI